MITAVWRSCGHDTDTFCHALIRPADGHLLCKGQEATSTTAQFVNSDIHKTGKNTPREVCMDPVLNQQ